MAVTCAGGLRGRLAASGCRRRSRNVARCKNVATAQGRSHGFHDRHVRNIDRTAFGRWQAESERARVDLLSPAVAPTEPGACVRCSPVSASRNPCRVIRGNPMGIVARHADSSPPRSSHSDRPAAGAARAGADAGDPQDLFAGHGRSPQEASRRRLADDPAHRTTGGATARSIRSRPPTSAVCSRRGSSPPASAAATKPRRS